MQEVWGSESAGQDAQARRLIESTWARDPLDEPRVRRWHAARRVTLLALLTYLGIQYYFFDVYLSIMALPGAGVITAAS